MRTLIALAFTAILATGCSAAGASSDSLVWTPRQAPSAVLYVLHGSGGSPADAFGGYGLDDTAQALIDAGYIEPVAIVSLPVEGWLDMPEPDARYVGLPAYAIGFSMGGYVALRWAFAGGLAGVGAISPAIYPDVPDLEPSAVRVSLGYGDADHAVIIDETEALGREFGVTPHVVSGGHDLVTQLALIPMVLRDLLSTS